MATASNAPSGTKHTHAGAGDNASETHRHVKATIGHGHVGLMPMVKGADDPNDKDEGTAADTDDGTAMMSERTALVALEFTENARMAEGKPVPFLTVGNWNFPNDYGEFTVTRDDLRAVKELFDADARQQTIPIINEAHNPSRAIGWITSLDFDGDDRLVATPDWNSVGQALLGTDEYRYTSPELLRNWVDPASGTTYPLIASGLAMTNFPRLKALGRIAASEAPAVAAVLAMGEDRMSAATPALARAALLAEAPVTPVWLTVDGEAPIQIASVRLGEKRAVLGLGNPEPAPASPPVPPTTDTGVLAMADEPKTAPEKAPVPATAPGAAPAPAPDPAVSNDPVPAPFVSPGTKPSKEDKDNAIPSIGPARMSEDVDLRTMLMAEQKNSRALAERFEASEAARLTLAETVNKMVRDKVVGSITTELDELRRSGRITPAEIEKLCPDDDHAVFLSEHRFVLDTYASRPRNAAVPFGEIGTSGHEGSSDPNQKLLALAEEARKADPKLTSEIAYAQALAQHPELYAEYAAARGNFTNRVSA